MRRTIETGFPVLTNDTASAEGWPATLSGFLNLSAFANGQLIGENIRYAHLGGETPFGPVYLGFGRSSQGPTNAYRFLGTP